MNHYHTQGTTGYLTGIVYVTFSFLFGHVPHGDPSPRPWVNLPAWVSPIAGLSLLSLSLFLSFSLSLYLSLSLSLSLFNSPFPPLNFCRLEPDAISVAFES